MKISNSVTELIGNTPRARALHRPGDLDVLDAHE